MMAPARIPQIWERAMNRSPIPHQLKEVLKSNFLVM
jgi:hypothetical protein